MCSVVSLVLPLAVAVAGSLAIEIVAGPHPLSRRPADLAIRLGSYALIAVFWFAFSWRPWQACATCLGTVATTALVDRLKRRVLGEPLVFSDVALLGQVPRHPELYYTTPLTHPRMAGPMLAGLGVVALWYATEPSALPDGLWAKAAAILGLPLALLVLALLARTRFGRGLVAARVPRPDLDADVRRYGVLATMLAYLVRRDAEAAASAPEPLPVPADEASNEPANKAITWGDEVVVVVQLESFLDPERLGGPPLPLMRRIRAEACEYGRLTVPAHGAYTMRSEHAVLTGREGASLGFGAFDPYLATKGRDRASLARRARAAGYASVFVHPYHPDFFDRAAVMRALGFGRLVMETDFSGAPRVGPYIADAAVAERILAEVRARPGPIFVFCATMENHGPWKPGRLPGIDDPLAQYLHHVGNAGRAVEALIDGLAALSTTATLCVFGDHAPSLPCYRPGAGDARTDYAIFRLGRPPRSGIPRRLDRTADALGRRLRDALSEEISEPSAPPAVLPRS